MAIRLYLNINNVCNLECPFCCMHSSPRKTSWMSFDTFKQIIDSKTDEFELQLEGGEPLMNRALYLFMNYAVYTGRCRKIIITTNGKLLDKHFNRLITFSKENGVKVVVKMSVNYWVIQQHNNDRYDFFKRADDYYSATEFIEDFEFKLNVRLRKDDEDKWIEDKLKETNLDKISSVYLFNSYGKLKDTDYPAIVIKHNIEDWFVYSVDGVCFHQDLETRANYEEKLP